MLCRIFVVQVRAFQAGDLEKSGGGTWVFPEGRFHRKSCRTVVNRYFEQGEENELLLL